MTSKFEQQNPSANSALTRSAPRPRHTGVQLPREPKADKPKPQGRPPEPKSA